MVKTGKSTETSLIIVMGVCLFLYALWMCAQPGSIADLWWQLRIGDEIRLTHHIPRHDEFSWTCFGRPIVLHEWGSCLIFAECYLHLGGLTGILIVEAVLAIVILEGLFALLLTRSASPIVAFFLTLTAGRLCVNFLSPRPHLFTFICLLASLSILFAFQKKHKITPAAFALLIAVQIVWVNLHAAGPMFVAICICFAVGDGIHYFLELPKDKERAALYLKNVVVESVCGAASLAAMIVNPFGFKVFGIFLSTVSNRDLSSSGMATEWQPADFHDTYGRAIEVFIFLIAFVLVATKRKQNIGDVIALIVLIFSAIYAVRNGPILGLAGSTIVAPYVAASFAALVGRYPILENLASLLRKKYFVYAMTVTVSLILVFSLGLYKVWTEDSPAEASKISGFSNRVFMVKNEPEDACAFIEKEGIPPSLRLYNEYNSGGYIIWRLRNYPVFTSTEAFVYFGRVFDAYLQMDHLPFDWRSVIDHYNPQLVIMGTDDIQARLFLDAPDWALVYSDRPQSNDPTRTTNFVFVKRLPGNADVIRRCRADCPEVKAVAARGYLSAK